MTACVFPLSESPGYNRGLKVSKTTNRPTLFLFPKESEMSERHTETSGNSPDVTREQALFRLHKMLRDLGSGESTVKGQIRQAARAVDGVMSPSRVRDIFNKDRRVVVRQHEHESVMKRWERWLEREERRLAECHARARAILQRRGQGHAETLDTAGPHAAADPVADSAAAGIARRPGF